MYIEIIEEIEQLVRKTQRRYRDLIRNTQRRQRDVKYKDFD
jgi:hypothetical protein